MFTSSSVSFNYSVAQQMECVEPLIFWINFCLFFTVVTLYATLGEDAIIHGINEAEISLIITSASLLPKLQVRNLD